MPRRIDVFSTKGGVGKTTLAFHIAQTQAQKSGRPSLLIDADLTGSCLGNLLEPWIDRKWPLQSNLVPLLCGTPELLPETLAADLPVYELRPAAPPAGQSRAPLRVTAPIARPAVLFCPSHADSVHAAVSRPVLQALINHESAAGWVGHVIEAVIRRTAEVAGDLAAVVVDHGPGMAALQWSTLLAINEAAHGRAHPHGPDRALLVTTGDLVDLKANEDLVEHLKHRTSGFDFDALLPRLVWAVNRLSPRPDAPQAPAHWREWLPERPEGQWFEGALPLFWDDVLARAYARAELCRSAGPEGMARAAADQLDAIRARLFEGA